jgi:hypothetical protein
MKKNYMTPYAQMNVIASRDVIALSFVEKTTVNELDNDIDIDLGLAIKQ